MPFSLLPKIITEKLTDITPELLRARKIRLLMLDFDNTIVPYTTNVPTDKMRLWLETMLESDISLCVVSNSRNDRVRKFCEEYGLACVTNAKKPFSKGIRECIEMFQIDPEFCALAGDQIFTDILCGKNAGIRTAAVKPIGSRATRFIAVKRFLERPIWRAYFRRKEDK